MVVMMNRLTNVEIADDGWPVLAVAGLLTIFMTFAVLPIGCFLLGVLLWLAHILRVPNRHIAAPANTVVAPVDGRIVQIERCSAGSDGTQLPYDAIRITLRTRLTDAQLLCSPADGYLVDNCLLPGMFAGWPGIDGDLGKIQPDTWRDARHFNERRELTIKTNSGYPVLLVQLATKTARQLVCRLADGKQLAVGNPMGIARIAGVTEIYLPANSKLKVVAGQRVVGAETVLAALPPAKAGDS